MTLTADTPVLEHDGRVLDWRPRYDPRSLEHRVAAVAGTTLPTTGRLWAAGPVLDQGREGACVGFGCSDEAAAQPVPVPGIGNRYALGYYRAAQKRDEWPGEAYEGTSVLAGLLEGRARGLYAGFRWAKTAEELAAGIVLDEAHGGGPAIIGVQWNADSYTTDKLGVLKVSGAVVGGHCLCVLGFIPAGLQAGTELEGQLLRLGLLEGYRAIKGPAFVILNSWGTTFGVKGLALVPLEAMRTWVRAGGEFAIPQGRKLPATKRVRTAQAAPVEATADQTLLPFARDLQARDRIVEGVPADFHQETVTVVSKRIVRGVGGDLVRVRSVAGVFTVRASDRLKVRRPIA
jgi:hypothetical protein